MRAGTEYMIKKAQLTEKVPPPLSFPALTSLKVFGMSSHSISSVQHLLRAALLLSFRRLPSDIVTFTYSTWQGKTSTLIELWFPRLLSMIWNLRVADKDSPCNLFIEEYWHYHLRADNWLNSVKIDKNKHFLVCEIFSEFVSARTNSGLQHGMTQRHQEPKKNKKLQKLSRITHTFANHLTTG